MRALKSIQERLPVPGDLPGQSLVEFAVSLVLLLVMVAGLVDASRALYAYMSLRDAAEEGALYGATAPWVEVSGNKVVNPAIEVRTRDNSDYVRGLGTTNMQVAISFIDPKDLSHTPYTGIASNPPCLGYGIRVRTSISNFGLTMPFIGAIVGSQTIPISAEITNTVLKPHCPEKP